MKEYTRKHKYRRLNEMQYITIGAFLTAAVLGICMIIFVLSKDTASTFSSSGNFALSSLPSDIEGIDLNQYPAELEELLSRNPETLDFVKSYPDRASLRTQSIDLSKDITPGQPPLFLQWDTRWGWNYYGNDFIAIAGCGPACLSMAYVYLTGDNEMNPRKMSEWAYNMGYYSSSGTKWSLWTEGVNILGLSGYELSLNESSMKKQLDRGGLIICSMSPGDFTTTGHIILIRGYDENGFYVNDPNSIKRSGMQWSYPTLQKQIKGMWGISK